MRGGCSSSLRGRLERIVRDPELLEGLCELLAELAGELRPLSIVVAGSLARGEFVRGMSDIDVLVIVESVSDGERFRLRAVGSTDVEITVVGLGELVEAVRRGNQFYRRSLEEGVEVYGELLGPLRRALQLPGGGAPSPRRLG